MEPWSGDSINLRIGARSDRTDDVTIAMKPQAEPSPYEVLAGLVERVTYHNAEAHQCPLWAIRRHARLRSACPLRS